MASISQTDKPLMLADTQPAPVVIYTPAPRTRFVPAYALFLIKWTPLLLLGFLARESHSEIVALIAAIVGVGYIFWHQMREEDK